MNNVSTFACRDFSHSRIAAAVFGTTSGLEWFNNVSVLNDRNQFLVRIKVQFSRAIFLALAVNLVTLRNCMPLARLKLQDLRTH
jgi:hypothetical protein